jgi:threonine dehydratase
LQPEESGDAFLSKQVGEQRGHTKPAFSIADGLMMPLGTETWPIVRDLVDEVLMISEAEIKASVAYNDFCVWEDYVH